MEVGCVRDGLLLHPFPHPSLAMDLVAEEPNAWKSAIDKTHSYHMGKEEFVEQTPRVHRSIERICTYSAFVREETCNCQIEQHSYMQNITHTLVMATLVSTSSHAWMS
jgi:hypothetical protein